MSIRMIWRLVVKDCTLMRWPLAGYSSLALLALLLALWSAPARYTAITLSVNILIALSFHLTLGPVLGERDRRTLPFVMSLPVSPRDVGTAKLMASYLMFIGPGLLAATTLVFLSPVDVFSSMAADGRPILAVAGAWLAYFGIVLGAWLVLFSVVLAAAVVSESIGWTVAVITGIIFVLGNALRTVLSGDNRLLDFLAQLHRGGPPVLITFVVELLAIALVIAAMLWLQGRKTSFV